MTDPMPAEAIDDHSAAHRFVAKRSCVVSTKPVAGHDPVGAVREAPRASGRTGTRGILSDARPFPTGDGRYCEGEGMIIVRAASLEGPHSIAERDPMHGLGARSFRIRPWTLDEGNLDVKISLLTGQFELR